MAKSWKGQVPLERRKEAPPTGYVANRGAWEKLWKAYRSAEAVPALDFQKELVLVAVNSDPNDLTLWGSQLDAKGDLRVQYFTTQVAYLKPTSGALMRGLILDALSLARESGDFRRFRAAYHQRFRQTIACDSRETIPATIAICLVAGGDPVQAVEMGSNFGRDSDTS